VHGAFLVVILPPMARRDAAQVFGKCVDVADDVPFLIVAGISKHDRSAGPACALAAEPPIRESIISCLKADQLNAISSQPSALSSQNGP
jgi:hypothetical protein